MQVLTTSQDMHVGSGVNTLLHGDNRGASYAHRIEYSVLMHDTISTVIRSTSLPYLGCSPATIRSMLEAAPRDSHTK